MLARHDASINEPDAFGRTPISRAKDCHLELDAKKLLELQAEDNLSLEVTSLCLENSVKALSLKLLQPPNPRWCQKFAGVSGSGEWMPCTIWIGLGRCLLLGGDPENGIHALEQIFYRKADHLQPTNWRAKLLCYYCGSGNSVRFHVCEDCDGSMFCDRCSGRHRILFRDSTYSRAVTDIPRDSLRDVPERETKLQFSYSRGDARIRSKAGSQTSIDYCSQIPCTQLNSVDSLAHLRHSYFALPIRMAEEIGAFLVVMMPADEPWDSKPSVSSGSL